MIPIAVSWHRCHQRRRTEYTPTPAQYAASPTRAAQLALLDQLLVAWANTSNLAERMEERTTQYRFRYMAFGDVRRSQHVAAVDELGIPYYNDTDATDVTLGEDTTLNRRTSRIVPTPSTKVSLRRTARRAMARSGVCLSVN
ncbi:MAG: hypothetical protein KF766_07685 [Rhodocyclaceae bacterium]|nr:hypothetical protein [Rhodocyclaceae bacterium]